MVSVKDLWHDYEGKGNPAVRGVSFEIGEGEVFGFLGPSGAGKSTVQALMTGLLRLQRGAIEYGGKPLAALSKSFYEGIGVSFEFPNLYGKLTGLENLRFYAGLFSGPTEEPMALLDRLGLREAAGRRVSAYSKGMKQRLVFARALVNKPRILFLDEPTGGLDPGTAILVKDIIKEKRRAGGSVFLTTHNMGDADELCDRVAFLNEGAIVASGSPRSLKIAHGEKAVRVEYAAEGGTAAETLFLDKAADLARMKELADAGRIETMHSQEASLAAIFVKLTGRGLG